MSGGRDELISQVVEAVRSSPKYRAICADFVRRIAALELGKGRSFREAVKAYKRKLHQVAGAYLDMGVHYPEWLEELRRAAQRGKEELRNACARIMGHHASTRERLPILDQFYAVTLAGLPPVRTVVDVGCGLHPLAIPWMPLAEGAVYYAYDVYEDMTAFLEEFMALVPVQGRAEALDVLDFSPGRADVAFFLKMVSCLEQVDKEAGRRLLAAIPADYVIVSFPVHSLGGRGKGMRATYETHFRRLVEGRDWGVEQFDFSTELVFRVRKG